MRRLSKIIALFCLWLCTAPLPAATSGHGPPLILGVHPYLPPHELIERFTPLARYLSRATGRQVEVRVGQTYAEHINALGTGLIDIAYMGPASYVTMTRQFGPRPLLARQVINHDPLLKGEIIVRQDSPIKTLSDFRGKCFYFGDVNSTMSHILPELTLARAGVPLSQLGSYRSLKGHDNIALGVLSGDCDGGAVKSEVYEAFKSRGLRVVAELPEVADHVLVASNHLPPELVRQLRQAILDLNHSPEGHHVMTSIHLHMTGLVPARDSDYASLRELMATAAHTSQRRKHALP